MNKDFNEDVSPVSTTIEDYDYTVSGMKWRVYLEKRWHNSNVWRYYYGKNLELSEADNIVNIFTLVSALAIAIPFSIASSLGQGFWDWLAPIIATCAEPPYYDDVHELFINLLYMNVYSSLTAIVVAICYYMLRPQDPENFILWWKTGKYPVIVIFLCTTISVVAMMTLFGVISGFYTVDSSRLCEWTATRNAPKYKGAVAIMLIVLVLSILIML
jgi:hypothetical protein